MSKKFLLQSFNMLGGMRTDKPLTGMEPSEALYARNVRFRKTPQPSRRKGGVKFHPDQMPSATAITGLFDFQYEASGQKFLECNNTVIYTDDGTTRTPIKTGMTAALPYSFATFDDFCWITNGTNTPLKYDGATVTNASLAAPAVGTFAGAVAAGAGLDAGLYRYLVTFYVTATGQESQPFALGSAPEVTITAGSGNYQVDLTNVPVSADTQVTARRIYRTTAGGSIYNAAYVGAVADNATTIYTDSVNDTSLSSLVNLDQDPMPLLKKLVVHKNRGFGFINNSSRLYFSKHLNMWYWPQGLVDLSESATKYYIDIDPEDGDRITNIVPFEDELVIFKRNSIHVLSGYDEFDFARRKVEYHERIGCAGSRAAVVAENILYFIDGNGIYATNKQGVVYAGQAMESFFNPSNPITAEKVNPAYLADAIAILYDKKPSNLVMFYIPTGSSTANDVAIVYDYKAQFWGYDTGYYVTAAAIRQVSNADTLMRGDNYGYVWIDDYQEGEGGLVYSTATAGAATTLTDASQTWTVDGYKGAYVEILSGVGRGQRRLITANTATALTVAAWDTVPDETSKYTIGGIDYFYMPAWNNYGDSFAVKRLNFINTRIEATGSYSINFYVGYDFGQTMEELTPITITASSLWGVGLWGVMTWGGKYLFQSIFRTPPNRVHAWQTVAIQHKPAGQPVTFSGFDKIWQFKGMAISGA